MIVANVTLNSLELGEGTSYPIDEPGISGLGVPNTKTADTTFDGRDGAFAAPDFLETRVITVPIIINTTGADNAMSLLDALNTAWSPARDGVDVELDIQIETWAWAYLGRPRGVEVDLTLIGSGVAQALCRFDATDPAGEEVGS